MIRRNLISIFIALVILYLSLTGSDSFDKFRLINIPFLDKIVHAGMYFTLMLSLLFENRALPDTAKKWIILTVIPFLYGVLMELLQVTLTSSRRGDLIDICFNLSGILLAILFWILSGKFAGRSFK